MEYGYSCDQCQVRFQKEPQFLQHFFGSPECQDSTLQLECPECLKIIPGISNLGIHMKTCGDVQRVEVTSIEVPLIEAQHAEDQLIEVPSVSKRKDVNSDLPATKRRKTNNFVNCDVCNIQIITNRYKMHLRTNLHKEKSAIFLRNHIHEIPVSSDVVKHYRVYSTLNKEIILKTFLNSITHYVKELIIEKLIEFDFIKLNMTLYGIYVKKDAASGETIQTLKHFPSTMKIIRNIAEIDEIIEQFYNEIEKNCSEYQERDSGWAIERFRHLDIVICKLESIPETSAKERLDKKRQTNMRSKTSIRLNDPIGSYINLPKEIGNKRAVTNIRNNDVYCFKWSILAAIALKHDNFDNSNNTVFQLTNTNYYRIADISSAKITFRGVTIDFAGIQFPIVFEELKIFERNNPNISINIYDLCKKNGKYRVIGPSRHTQNIKETHINLLTLEKDDMYHFALIRNMQRLVKTQFTSSDRPGIFCDLCQNFYFIDSVRHKTECSTVTTTYPKEGSELKFKNFEKKISPPVVVYADMESILEPIENTTRGVGTTVIQKHIACAVGYHIKHTYNSNLDEYHSFEGKTCVQDFLKDLHTRMDDVYNTYYKESATHIEIILAAEDKINCCACSNSLNGETTKFYHPFSGKLMGYIHEKCIKIFRYRVPFIPIFFHNLCRYDIHLFVTHLEKNISVIPCNKELYIAITKKIFDEENNYKLKYTLNFVDSNRFLNSSLDKLASYLAVEDFKILKKMFPSNDDFQLMNRKGVYPYDYMDSFEKLDEISLPDKEFFFNYLDDSECSEEDYNFAHNVWNNFNCQSLRDYTMLYLKSDVLILADIFEKFRKVCIDIYELDPSNYVTAPSLSWDAMMKFTNVSLELISDPEIHSFLKTAIRGGITQCTVRHSKANNKYLRDYNPSESDNYLSYIDANNLYGWAMSQKIPFADFSFMDLSETQNFKEMITDYKDDSDYGYILEVDLEYPPEIHDKHNYLPFCPEIKKPPGGKVKKLITDFEKKQNYRIHIKMLQLCLEQGLVLTKIHKVLRFKQSAWLEPYIALNTRHRKLSSNEFEKNFFKLMNNAVYGKTMENVDKRRDVRLVTNHDNRPNSEGYRSLIAKPNFSGVEVFENGIHGIELNKLEIYQDKPIYIGVTVLELSKWLMYDFYYNFLKKEDDNLKCIYMDTDSFVISSQKDIYNIMKKHPTKFDTSDYTEDNVFGIKPMNKKVLGLMKDENAGRLMKEFVGLKAKAYSYTVENDESNIKTVKKIKGVKKCVVKRLDFNKFKESALNRKTFYGEQRVIRSRSHILHTEIVNKISLNFKDDKRYILPDGINTLAWGHKDIPN